MTSEAGFEFEKEKFLAEREGHISQILGKLRSEEWRRVLDSETVGDKTRGGATINTRVKKSTGEILAFGNIQDLPPETVNDPQTGLAHLVYRVDMKHDHSGKLSFAEGLSEFVNSGDVTKEAMENLKEALERYKAKPAENKANK